MSQSRNVCARGLRADDVAHYIGASKSHVWHLAKNDPTFPHPRRVGPRMTIWLREEVDQWLDRSTGSATLEA